MCTFYLGVDLHLKRSYVVLMKEDGQIIDQRGLPNDIMKEYLTKHVPRSTYAVLEATRNWAFMYDLLTEHVERVELAHPKDLKAIASAAVKTDQIDARVLAHLARLNYLPTAYAAPLEIRDLRQFTRHRTWLVGQRTQAKNRIHAVLAGYNLVSPVSDLFGVQGRECLAQWVKDALRPAAVRVIQDNLDLIDTIHQQLEFLEKNIQLSPEEEQAVRLLMSLPGVGKITATTIVAEIGDITRFGSSKSLCNWSGLTPRVRKSDEVVRHGKISKEGSPYLRAAMVRAATAAVKKSPRWRTVHKNLSRRSGKRAARVAVARRLLTVAYHMLQRNEPYQEDYQQKGHSDRGA
jgi:transposase